MQEVKNECIIDMQKKTFCSVLTRF